MSKFHIKMDRDGNVDVHFYLPISDEDIAEAANYLNDEIRWLANKEKTLDRLEELLNLFFLEKEKEL